MNVRPALVDKRVLVTGGAGFIGSHLVDALIEGGAREVVVVDNMFVGSDSNLADADSTGRLTLYRDDAEFRSTLDYIFAKHDIDAVFNCATKALNYSFLNPGNAFSTNVTVAVNLLDLQRSGAFGTLCHFSTSEVYGTAVYEPMDEAHPRIPTTTYAAGKAAADLAVESYVRMFGLDAFIVRPFNNYGPRQNHKGILAAVIPITIARILNGISPEVHGDGSQSRDFIYVGDTVAAVLELFRRMPAGDSVNIASNHHLAIGNVVELICEFMAYRGEVVRRAGRKSDVLCHNASTKKLDSMTQLSLTPFDAGLRQTIDWYRTQLQAVP